MQRCILFVLAVVACGNSHATVPDASSVLNDATSSSDATTTCASTELCDGVIDDNCDGQVDEGCGRCPLLAVTCPTGCCPVPSWQLEASDTTGASVVVDDAGNIYVLYSVSSGAPWHAWLATYRAIPGTWSKRDLGVGGTYRNRVVLDHQSRLHLLHGGSDGSLFYDRSDDGGQTFAVQSTVGPLAIGGTFDLAVDSTGNPHVVWDAQGQDVFSRLTYATYDGTWHPQLLDLTSTQSAFPTLALGFADRPHIVTEAYHPDGASTGTSKRYISFDGNQWRYQNIDLETGATTFNGGDHYFSAQALVLAADDSATVSYTTMTASVESLVLATRPPGATSTWTTATVAGVTSFDNASLVSDPAGGLLAVTDGIALQRGAIWQTTSTGIVGNHVASFRRSNSLYLVFNMDTAGGTSSLQITVVPL